MTSENGITDADQNVLGLLNEVSAVCSQVKRSELSATLAAAAVRMHRPTTVICVIGEYKQGKSHIVNALIGRSVVPVDDDLATATITVIGPGEPARALVHRTEGGERVTDEIPLEHVRRFTAESVADGFPSGIDFVEVILPSLTLARGIAIVDTPGVNALRPSNERAILDFLAYADGLILASDASAELSPAELRFLDTARLACPTILVGLCKIDLYPEWRRIAELDRHHLSGIGLPDSLVPISSALRQAAATERSARLDEESGFPTLLSVIEEQVLDDARSRSRRRALEDLDRVLQALRSTEYARLKALRNPADAERRLAELRRAEQATVRMREASAKWTIALNDGIGDLRTGLNYRLRTEMRRQLQESDRKLAESGGESGWEAIIEELKSSLSDLASEVFDGVRDGTGEIATRIADMIAEDVPDLEIGRMGVLDIDELWSSANREPQTSTPGLFSSGLGVLRGGYSGMLMLSMLSQLAGIAVLVPVSLGAGVLLGAKQLRDERKRHRERQRQEGRNVLRQFLDQVQLELGNRIQISVQEAHRELRDHFSERIGQLSAAYVNATRILEEAIAADTEERRGLAAKADERIEHYDRLLEAVATVRADPR